MDLTQEIHGSSGDDLMVKKSQVGSSVGKQCEEEGMEETWLEEVSKFTRENLASP